jgi:RimJ/RimL family protein N-acetyltransferase
MTRILPGNASLHHTRGETDADARSMTDCLSQWETAQWLVSVPHPYVHQESLDWIREVVPEGWRTGSEFWLGIVDANTDEFLGEIGIRVPASKTRCGEIGYWLVPAARGRGVMRRALTLMIDWAFTDLGLQRIDWSATVGNVGSRSVAESLGFRMEGIRRQRAYRESDDTRHDEWVAGLLRAEWRSSD